MERTSYVWKDEFEDNFAAGHDMVGSVIEYKKRTVPGAGGSLLTTIADYTTFIEAVMQRQGLDPKTWETMVSPTIRIDSKRQFPTLSSETSHDNDPIALSYGLGWGTFRCPRGRAFFKEGHGPGFQHYNVNFIDEKISVILMTNSDNGESIFKPLLGSIAGDTYSPWEWEAYVPYNEIEPRPIGVYLYDFLLLGNAENAVETYRAIKHSPLRERFIFDESQLLDLGGQMMKEGKADYAIELFTLNIAEYPESASSYESLGDAHREKGRILLARDSYQKSLDLDPGSKEVQKKLNMLK
jgi:CubicO group peptidase (beta-lactamase class C family)